MCGISGFFFASSDHPVDPDVLRSMSGALAHRGPDAEGFWIGPGIGLAHRRLSIIDLEGGDQPIGNEDGTVQVIFNGEIYNYQVLRDELESRGHWFQTRSDTEVLVHLYEEQGENLVERLRGMFAFALWDGAKRRLLLARDRLGIKPLYLYRDEEVLLFGSELKAILAYPGIAREVAPEGVESFLTFGFVPGPNTIFRGIVKLPPAHTLMVGSSGWNRPPRRYWNLRFEPDRTLCVRQWEELIRAKIDEVVGLHLIADVPVGAFLSGGLDSGSVVASSSRKHAEPIQTFSIGFQERSFNELPLARLVAERYGTRHVEEVITPDAVTLLDELSLYYDEPFADPSAIPTYLVSRLASQSVKVVLSGDGGDEAFGGYSRYAHDLVEARLRDRFPVWFRRAVIGPLARAWPAAGWLPRPLRAKIRLTNLSLEDDAAYANTLALCRTPLRRQLLAHELAAGLGRHDPGRVVRDGYTTGHPADPLAGMIGADIAVVLPDDFLVKVDRASMAHSLEVRPPLLDHELLELAARIPSELKVRGRETKWIFKQACRDRLPEAILRSPKRGFDLPIDSWLRGPLREPVESIVLDPRSRVGSLINQSVARRIFRDHLNGSARHGRILWSLLVLARWSDRYLETTSEVMTVPAAKRL